MEAGMFNAKLGPQQVSQALAVQAPTGGLNDLDPLSAMGPEFLIDVMNFYPDTGILSVRPGYQEWATSISNPLSPIHSIMSYQALDGSTEIFCADVNFLYDITTPGADPPAVAEHSANSNNPFIDTNFATAAGQFLIAVDSFVTMFYDGTTWGRFMQVAPATADAPGEIEGVDPNTFSFVLVHKGRLWFIEKNTMTAWYLPIDSMGGVCKPFFVGGLFKRGGYLTMLARWSADTGDGLDDRIVFMTSMGEIASYSGNDPENAEDWFLDSIWYIAPPLSTKSCADYGGDILFLSRRGLVPLSSLVTSSITEILYSNTLTRRISRTLIKLASQGGLEWPIEISVHPDSAWVVINIQDRTTYQPIQLVMNFLTGAWGKFDYPARTIRTADRNILIGTNDNRVLVITPEHYQDNVDLEGNDGVPIEAYAFSAYSYFENPTANKHAKLIRPVFHTEVKPSFRMRVLPDFRLDKYITTPSPGLAAGNAKWDISEWDEANWAGYENVYRPWVSANVLGYAFAWQLRVSTSSAFGVAALEWVYEAGGLV
jgi:hypothetical protein